jgi:hypothetical protein
MTPVIKRVYDARVWRSKHGCMTNAYIRNSAKYLKKKRRQSASLVTRESNTFVFRKSCCVGGFGFGVASCVVGGSHSNQVQMLIQNTNANTIIIDNYGEQRVAAVFVVMWVVEVRGVQSGVLVWNVSRIIPIFSCII